jgi:galactose mutarotase-like enzyme
MSQCQQRAIIYEGFEALEMSNEEIALIVVPDLGGKVASITHRSTQREWLWKSPYLAYREPIYGASYIHEFDLGGLDECFPTIAPTFFPAEPWAGTRMPDHGEVWSQAWDVEIHQSPERIELAMGCYGVRLPYRFERTITVEADKALARLDYRVTNLSPFAMPFIWSIHPLLNIEPGMRLSLPAGVSQIRVDFSTNDLFGKTGTLQPWPLATATNGQPVDLSEIQPPSFAQGVKYFTLPLTGDDRVEASLTDSKGERSFRFRFSPSEISHIGVWMNCAGWTPLDYPPYYNLALEPCIGASDSLTVAVNHWREHSVLGSRQERRWGLEIILT